MGGTETVPDNGSRRLVVLHVEQVGAHAGDTQPNARTTTASTPACRSQYCPCRMRRLPLSLSRIATKRFYSRRGFVKFNYRRGWAGRRLRCGAASRSCVLRDAPSRALLRMRQVFHGIKKVPHPEGAAQRPSRRTHRACPAQFQFFHGLLRRDDEDGGWQITSDGEHKRTGCIRSNSKGGKRQL